VYIRILLEKPLANHCLVTDVYVLETWNRCMICTPATHPEPLKSQFTDVHIMTFIPDHQGCVKSNIDLSLDFDGGSEVSMYNPMSS
jgi:hypothetical protein